MYIHTYTCVHVSHDTIHASHDTEIYYNRTFQPKGLHQLIQKEMFRLKCVIINSIYLIKFNNKQVNYEQHNRNLNQTMYYEHTCTCTYMYMYIQVHVHIRVGRY